MSKPEPQKSKDLLARRVEEFDIPAWPGQACFERIIVYRIPDEASARQTFSEGGTIIKPDMTQQTQKDRSPRGVVVSAGLEALDVLESHGMEVGELVWFSPHVPYRFEVERTTGGKPIEFFFMNVGDIILSEDILGRIYEENSMCIGTSEQSGKHVYVRAGKSRERVEPKKFPDDI